LSLSAWAGRRVHLPFCGGCGGGGGGEEKLERASRGGRGRLDGGGFRCARSI
jgi:hypothetical protein